MAEQTCPPCYGTGMEHPFSGSRAHKRRESPGSGVSLVTYAVTVMAYAVTVHRMRKEERYATERRHDAWGGGHRA
jgi:hypothetical protein